eukprot:Rhum_TRINITY_DN5293_c0_g1::Rhum_TRINITY_DN5293_c0_g1_i1::g.16857::m.16857/K14379/ACP5; tartrate-resistant acid phosphatase type 5
MDRKQPKYLTALPSPRRLLLVAGSRWRLLSVIALVAAVLLVLFHVSGGGGLFGAAKDELVFISFGDWGTGKRWSHQLTVAQRLAVVAPLVRAEFVVNLGDSFYPVGVKSVDDPLWESFFEKVYADPYLRAIPWHGVLGDHDHQGSVQAILEYASKGCGGAGSTRWRLPAPYYTFAAPAGRAAGSRARCLFVMTDSVGMEAGVAAPGMRRRFQENYRHEEYTGKAAGAAQKAWLSDVLGGADAREADWVIAVGHRPILTGGQRDRTEAENATAAVYRQMLLGSHVQVWLGGHDHTFQVLKDATPGSSLHYIVAGGGGYARHNVSTLPETVFAGSYYGFCVHRVTRAAFTTEFHDAETGEIRFTHTVPNVRWGASAL